MIHYGYVLKWNSSIYHLYEGAVAGKILVWFITKQPLLTKTKKGSSFTSKNALFFSNDPIFVASVHPDPTTFLVFIHCTSVSAVLIKSLNFCVLFIFSCNLLSFLLVQVMFLFLWDNLFYSCTSLALPRLAFQLPAEQTISHLCISVERIKT